MASGSNSLVMPRHRLDFLLFLALFWISSAAMGQNYSGLQNKELKKESSLSSMLSSDDEIQITKATVLVDREQSLTLSIEHQGLTEEHEIKVLVLDQFDKLVKGFEPANSPVQKNSASTEVQVHFDDGERNYNKAEITTQKLKVYAQVKSDDEGISKWLEESGSTFGSDVVAEQKYECKKKWRVSGKTATVKISLEPYKSAKSIQRK